jgi:hypothetical protein
MIAAQLIAAHNATMECYRRAMIGEQTLEGRRDNLSQALKGIRAQPRVGISCAAGGLPPERTGISRARRREWNRKQARCSMLSGSLR